MGLKGEVKLRKVTLKKISTNKNPWADEVLGKDHEIEGVIVLGPSVGQPFSVYFNEMKAQYLTTEVKNIQYQDEKTLVLNTMNSVYELTLGEIFND